jgi:hypothetical protein
MMDIKKTASSAITAKLEEMVSAGDLPRVPGVTYSYLADELADILVPMAARGADYVELRKEAVELLEVITVALEVGIDSYRVGDCAAEAIREAIPAVASPKSLQLLAALLPLLASEDDEDVAPSCRLLIRLSGGAARE